ncbi:hypothetical protein [Leuconostoc gasicomitatum]|uniref:hypothetical protein n=1 Tax=Leuconostoc gasicomitatum TaxID=115778 RepID=UPI000744A51D|nr:hypothetical protein [Leuconostoc gasicomitatum]CUR63904.1 Uncharacterized protein LEKG_1317 [Leuconostoc gasicomitatum KG16-1]
MSEEMKPVAYIWQTGSGEYLGVSRNISTSVNIPLYTKQQLQPRVKMTQAEFDEFKEIYRQCSSVYVAIDRIFKRHKAFPFLNKKVALPGCLDDGLSNQFAKAFLNFDPERPDETIEITPDKKWFVRLIPTIPTGDDDIYLDNELIVSPDYHSPKKAAAKFDTKEQAEEWTNPLTEAVLLPVGDK